MKHCCDNVNYTIWSTSTLLSLSFILFATFHTGTLNNLGSSVFAVALLVFLVDMVYGTCWLCARACSR